MIIGDCPYEDCDHPHMIGIAPECPAFSKQDCEGCERPYWLLHSRLSPEAYTPEQFAEKYEIDEESKVISARGGEGC